MADDSIASSLVSQALMLTHLCNHIATLENTLVSTLLRHSSHVKSDNPQLQFVTIDFIEEQLSELAHVMIVLQHDLDALKKNATQTRDAHFEQNYSRRDCAHQQHIIDFCEKLLPDVNIIEKQIQEISKHITKWKGVKKITKTDQSDMKNDLHKALDILKSLITHVQTVRENVLGLKRLEKEDVDVPTLFARGLHDHVFVDLIDKQMNDVSADSFADVQTCVLSAQKKINRILHHADIFDDENGVKQDLESIKEHLDELVVLSKKRPFFFKKRAKKAINFLLHDIGVTIKSLRQKVKLIN